MTTIDALGALHLSSYPVFNPDQLLTADQLNNVVGYLEPQSRLTRLWLIGAGIVCGLVPRKTAAGARLSPGCGVTSRGYLVDLDDGLELTRVTLDADVGFGSKADELHAAGSNEGEPIPAGYFDTPRVIALLIDSKDTTLDDCVTNCDAKSTERTFRVRKIALEKSVAEEILVQHYKVPDPAALERVFNGKYRLPDAYLERFGYTKKDSGDTHASLADIKHYGIFVSRYREVIKSGAVRLRSELGRVDELFSAVATSHPPGPALPALPQSVYEDASEPDLQYVYSHLLDLVMAYEELRKEAFDLMDLCPINPDWFPKHLFLGTVLESDGSPPIPPEPHRTRYFQPPIYNDNARRAAAARVGYERLRSLASSFKAPALAGDGMAVRVTPSRYGDASLGSRAIPFYYDPESPLRSLWNADLNRKGHVDRIHSYYAADGGAHESKPPYLRPLAYDFEDANFLRIEGHVGLSPSVAFERINQIRVDCNLPFDLVLLRIANDKDEVVGDGGDGDGDSRKKKDRLICELDILQSQYTKLRTDLKCAIGRSGGFDDLLTAMPDDLDSFDFAKFEEQFDVHADSQDAGGCLFKYDKAAFRTLHTVFNDRKSDVNESRVFHTFAQSHPGLEHKGGVPRGGTFALVYRKRVKTDEELARELREVVEGLEQELTEERLKEIKAQLRTPVPEIVADFCLPYSVSSSCPPVAFMIERPRPTLVVEKSSFCSDDGNRYPLIAHPPGGILSGSGVDADAMTFTPKEAGIPEGPVAVTYAVDGMETQVTLQILRVPDVRFVLKDRICREPIPLEGTPPGGEYTTDIDAANPKLGIRKEGGAVLFDPTIDGVPLETPIEIAYEFEGDNGCKATQTARTTVNKPPVATFAALKPAYCTDDDAVDLVPDVASAVNSFAVDEKPATQFVPAEIEFDDDDDGMKKVAVTHTAVDAAGCKETDSQTTHVFVHPNDPSMKARNGTPQGDNLRINVRQINPKQSVHEFYRYRFHWKDKDDNEVVEEDRKHSDNFGLMIPKARLDGVNTLELTMTVVVVFRGEEVCESLPVSERVDLA